MARVTGRLRKPRSRGQALAEFALIFPVFMILIVAGVDVGRGIFAYNSVTNAAREGARLAIVNQDTALVAQRAIAQSRIAETAAPNIRVTFWEEDSTADPSALTGDCDPVGYGCQALVRFETTFRPITPIISAILFPSGVTLVAISVEQVEYTCPTSTVSAANCPKQP